MFPSLRERRRELDQAKAALRVKDAELVDMIRAAMQNEALNRQRIEFLELWRNRGPLGRLKWLFFGY